MGDLAAKLKAVASDVPVAGAREGQPSVEWDGTRGALTTGPLEAQPESWDALIADWGLDPDEVQVVAGTVQIRAWDANVGGGEIKRLRYYKAQLERRAPAVDTEDLEDLKRALMRRKPMGPCASTTTGGTRIICASDWQLGKALHDETPILTPTGWTTHGQLRPGHMVYAPTGKPVQVTGVTGSAVQPLYRITFDDGAEVLASDDHIWEGWRRYKDATGTYSRRRVKMTTAEHAEMKRHGAHRSQGGYYVNALAVDLTEPLLGVEGADLPVDPYLLGAWLGDGNSRSGWITSSFDDAQHWLDSFPGSKQIVPNGPSFSLRIPGLTRQLTRAGILGDKHIPAEYLAAPAGDRLALVQGLMDTDGHITANGSAEFCQVNTRIADDFCFLVRSLGMKVKRRIKKTGRQDAHIVTFTPDASFPHQRVVRMDRKFDRLVDRSDGQSHYSFIRSVERVPDGPAQCITVDGGLYLCGEELKVTHNSDGDGVRGTVERIATAIDAAAKGAKGADRIVLAGLGDLVEGCDGHYQMQAFSVELDRREQVRLVRRLLLRAIDAFAPLAPLDVVCVPGNHGENRRNGKAFTTLSDNDDLAVFEQVADIVASTDRYPDVRFGFPSDDDELVLTVDCDGVGVAFAHGHQLSGGGSPSQKALRWWSGQAMGHRPAGNADILVSGHYHHLIVHEGSGRTWFQAPAMDGGSDWWTGMTGQTSPAGMLSFTVGAYPLRPWGDLSLT